MTGISPHVAGFSTDISAAAEHSERRKGVFGTTGEAAVLDGDHYLDIDQWRRVEERCAIGTTATGRVSKWRGSNALGFIVNTVPFSELQGR